MREAHEIPPEALSAESACYLALWKLPNGRAAAFGSGRTPSEARQAFRSGSRA